MKSTDGSDEAKRRAGESAAGLVEDGAVVGLGTGSTTAHAIRALGEAVAEGLDVRGVPTSYQSGALAREVGIPIVALADATPDIAIDGADQFAGGSLVKGGGAAHAREKVVDASADRLVVVADGTKRVDALDHPVPVEVLPDAVPAVEARVRDLGGDPTLRDAERKDGPVVTEYGNLVLDCAFGRIDAPADLAATLSAVPGVVEHGLFVELADEVHVGTGTGVSIERF
ncbi:ribose-5-phosphate isomerase RpiA [Halomarina halobia]|uniref:Ribose-5-phosphate isomerase A n=1 Tax=Halomarina halobia TaxID=3033386 RepID=A0ABD6A9P8_9EURY|nr:ribose-5-phosphate isomerase RpiA [Halomarina sp. PSR21]